MWETGPGNIFTVYAFEMGIVLEFVSLAISMAYNYSFESKKTIQYQHDRLDLMEENKKIQEEKFKLLSEKEILSEKVNKELQEKVQERTREVTEANNKLQLLFDKLESMSINLDKENWELKRDIKKEKLQRLSGEHITREEIQELYPSKLKCLEFLEDIKWPGTYRCIKCNHDNYSINKLNRSRKCSKCGKILSVTSGSLFHAQKAPLQDLFYLTHIAYSSSKLNVEELVEELSLSEASIYKFLKKVKEKKERNPYAPNWEGLIFL